MQTLANQLPSHQPIIFMDFDDVINLYESTNKYFSENKHLLPGYIQKTTIHVQTSGIQENYKLKWSAELTRKLMTLKQNNPYTWVWLTTWLNHTNTLDQTLKITSDYTAEWDAYPKTTGWIKLDQQQTEQHRNQEKLDYILDFTDKHPHTPFVWVDDSATKLWENKYLQNPNQPRLIITPQPKQGINLQQLNTIETFIKTHTTPKN